MASSRPPPNAYPFIAAMTGLPMDSIRRVSRWPRCAVSLALRESSVARTAMSAPATKAFSPAPVRMTARIEAESRQLSNVVVRRAMTSSLSALSLSGRLTSFSGRSVFLSVSTDPICFTTSMRLSGTRPMIVNFLSWDS